MRRLCDPEIMWVANQFVSLKWRLSYWILELWNTLTKPWSPTIPHRFWNFKSDIKGGSKDCLVFFTALICHLCSLEVWTERVRSCLWSLSCERGKYSWCQHCMEVVLGFEVWYLRNGRQAKLGGPSTTDNYVMNLYNSCRETSWHKNLLRSATMDASHWLSDGRRQSQVMMDYI